jgi:hypothetical protein
VLKSDSWVTTSERFGAWCGSVYEHWRARGAELLTPPIDRGGEIRCYMRDPDGHLIEVGQLVGRPNSLDARTAPG